MAQSVVRESSASRHVAKTPFLTSVDVVPVADVSTLVSFTAVVRPLTIPLTPASSAGAR